MDRSATSRVGHAMQVAVYGRMTPEQRVELAARMSDDVRKMALTGITAASPGEGERAHLRALVALLYGEALAAEAFDRG